MNAFGLGWARLALLGGCLVVAACGGAQAKKSNGLASLYDGAPDDAFVVVRIDIDRLRKSRHYSQFVPFIDKAKNESPAMARVLGQTHEALLAATAAHPSPRAAGTDAGNISGMLLLRGQYTPEELDAFHQERAKSDGSMAAAEKFSERGVSGWRWKDETRSFLLDAGLWLTVDGSWFPTALDAARKPDGKEALSALRVAGDDQPHDLVFTADLERLDRATVAALRSEARGVLKELASARRAVATLDVGDAIDLHVRITMPNANAAKSTTAQLEALRSQYAGNLMVRAMGISPVLEALSVKAKGDVVNIAFNLDGKTAASLLDRLSAVLGGALRQIQGELPLGGGT